MAPSEEDLASPPCLEELLLAGYSSSSSLRKCLRALWSHLSIFVDIDIDNKNLIEGKTKLESLLLFSQAAEVARFCFSLCQVGYL